MRIAVPMTEGGRFNEHFGQARKFQIVDVDDATNQIGQSYPVDVPAHGGCAVIPVVLAREGVARVLVGGIGTGAISNLKRFRIEPIVGASGDDPVQIVADYIAGRLALVPHVCEGHGHEHGHHHHPGGHNHRHEHHHGACCEPPAEAT